MARTLSWSFAGGVGALAVACAGAGERSPVPEAVEAVCSPLTLAPGELYRQDFEECADLRTWASVPMRIETASDAPAGNKVGAFTSAEVLREGPFYSSWLAPIAVSPGQPHCLDVWGRGAGPGLSFGIRQWDAAGFDRGVENVLVGVPGTQDDALGPVTGFAGGPGWRRAQRTFAPPAGVQAVQLFTTLAGATPPDAAVDGIRLWAGACSTRQPPSCSRTDGLRGLVGEYFDTRTFTDPQLGRLDGPVAFEWGNAAPDPIMGADTFSVRWTGYVEPRFTEPYVLSTRSDDGVRLWIDDRLVIDNWTDHGPTTNTATVPLTAGQKHKVRLDMYENVGGATLQWHWQSPSQPREAVPRAQLRPSLRTCESLGPLVAHWPFDDGAGVTAMDASCGGSLGVTREVTGVPWRAGQVAGALSLDGASSWVRIGATGAFDRVAATNQITIAGWINVVSHKPDWAAIATRQEGTGVWEHWGLLLWDGRPTMIVNSHEPGTHLCTGAGRLPVGQWTHVAGTFDGRTLRAYANGVEVCSVSRAVRLQPATTAVVLGGNSNLDTDDAQELLHGALDDVALYDRALSPVEIAGLSAGAACGEPAATP